MQCWSLLTTLTFFTCGSLHQTFREFSLLRFVAAIVTVRGHCGSMCVCACRAFAATFIFYFFTTNVTYSLCAASAIALRVRVTLCQLCQIIVVLMYVLRLPLCSSHPDVFTLSSHSLFPVLLVLLMRWCSSVLQCVGLSACALTGTFTVKRLHLTLHLVRKSHEYTKHRSTSASLTKLLQPRSIHQIREW